ncbi:MAG TPA: branched-chain amino acid ABC transporter permease [bacterium]|nr:branched-chain amino acid ABC transporter permease [bacterium]
MSLSTPSAARWGRWLLPVVILAAAVLFPLVTGPYPLAVARSVLTYMALAMSWDLLLRSGQISFGIAGFFGLGAYAAALSALRLGFSPVVSILAAGVVAAAVACILGVVILRLRAVYFAITTLALAEIFRVILQNGGDLSGGPEGLVMPGLIFNGEARALYWTSLAAVVVAGLVSAFFQRSRVRFALTAIRNNEVSARSSGIHTFTWLLVAFVTSSFIQGLAGGIQLQGYGFVSPDSVFDTYYTLLPLAMALLGGTYSTPGPILGALLLGVSAEYLKLKIPYGHLVVYGVIIVLVILLMPRGLFGVYRARVRGMTLARASRGGRDG